MKADWKESIRLAKEAGIKNKRIILDPGVGFGKTYENNLEAIRCLDVLEEMGYPVLLGTSRKSVIGLSLDLPSEERVEGTLVTTVFGVMQGAAFVRVHDVKENKRAITMAEAILGRKDLQNMDKIKIKNLEVFANHGVFPEETKLGQKFLINATLYTDIR